MAKKKTEAAPATTGIDPAVTAALATARMEREKRDSEDAARKAGEAHRKLPVHEFPNGVNVVRIEEIVRIPRTKFGPRTVCVYIVEATGELRKTFLPAAAYVAMRDARKGDRWAIDYRGKVERDGKLVHDVTAVLLTK